MKKLLYIVDGLNVFYNVLYKTSKKKEEIMETLLRGINRRNRNRRIEIHIVGKYSMGFMSEEDVYKFIEEGLMKLPKTMRERFEVYGHYAELKNNYTRTDLIKEYNKKYRPIECEPMRIKKTIENHHIDSIDDLTILGIISKKTKNYEIKVITNDNGFKYVNDYMRGFIKIPMNILECFNELYEIKTNNKNEKVEMLDVKKFIKNYRTMRYKTEKVNDYFSIKGNLSYYGGEQ